MAISCDVMLFYVSVAVLVTTGGDTTCLPCSSSSADNESNAHINLLDIDQQLSDTLSGNPLPHPVMVVSSSSVNKGAKQSAAVDHTADDNRNQSSRATSIRASLAGLLASLERRVEADDKATGGVVKSEADNSGMRTSDGKQTSSSSPGLLERLADILSRYGLQLPTALLTSPKPTDVCLRDNPDLMQYYCTGLSDGEYYDPWNPFCGFVQCQQFKSIRRACPIGRWMGFPRRGSTGVTMTQRDMCRTRLPLGASCSETTLLRNLCRQVEISNKIPVLDPAEDFQTSLSDLFSTHNRQ